MSAFIYEIEKAELIGHYARMLQRIVRRVNAKQRSVKRYLASIVVGLVLGCSLSYIDQGSYSALYGLSVFIFLFFLYTAYIYLFAQFNIRARMNIVFQNMPDGLMKVSLAVDERGLVLTFAGRLLQVDWACVDCVMQTEHGLEIDALGDLFFLPRRVFENEADMATAKAQMMRFWEDARNTPPRDDFEAGGRDAMAAV